MSIYDMYDDIVDAARDIRDCEGIVGRAVIMAEYLKEDRDAAGIVEALIFGAKALVRYHELQEEYIAALNTWLAECRRKGLKPGD